MKLLLLVTLGLIVFVGLPIALGFFIEAGMTERRRGESPPKQPPRLRGD